MAWGGLNPALTAWRTGINQRFPRRGTQSDGGYADKLHGSTSQHQPDSDGSVDAFDGDVNLLGSQTETGTAEERRLIEALKLDFEADRRSHLWIHQREISNEDVREWAERTYGGASAHDKHIHWESDPRYETDGSPWAFTHTDALLQGQNGDDEMIVRKGDTGEQVRFWQYVMADLGFPTGAGDAAYDGEFGPKMEAAVNAYRRAQGVNTTATLITGWTGWHMLRALAAKHAGRPGPAGPAGAPGPAGARGPAGPAGALTGSLAVTGGRLNVETVTGPPSL